MPGHKQTKSARPATGLCALVIDDEPAITQLIRAWLGNTGWTCVCLNDTLEIERVLTEQRFDLVISDLRMPGRNGLEILRLLREKWPALAKRFLLITGNLADDLLNPASLRDVRILRKPFAMEELSRAVSALLSSPRSTDS